MFAQKRNTNADLFKTILTGIVTGNNMGLFGRKSQYDPESVHVFSDELKTFESPESTCLISFTGCFKLSDSSADLEKLNVKTTIHLLNYQKMGTFVNIWS